MGLIPPEKIAEIRDRIDILSVVGEHVPLRRAGTNYLGLCPFHAEKTPSFNVNAAKQFFYCFGCQKSGDVFRFLMELEGRSFAEVARDLARRAAVEIPETCGPSDPRRQKEVTDERQRLLRLQDIAAAWFEGQLQKAPRALDYLRERGIGEEVRRRFRLGYAPEGWDGLLQVFEGKNVPWELYEKSGLGIRRAAEVPAGRTPATRNTHYDRFRDRVMFPLLSPKGEVIAFGGRVLPPSAPGGDPAKEAAKYINSPESPVYKKGDNLYGLHAAKDSIRKSRQVLLVEGNFDVLSLHQHGFPNAVAPMGTALTEAQVRLLSRLLGAEGHVVLMLDGDRAGRSATLKDIWLFSETDLDELALFAGSEVDVRVAQLPDGEDPDTYVARDRAGFERRLKTAKPAVDYVLDEAIKLAEHDNVAGKAKVLMQVAPLLKAVRSPPALELYVGKLALELGIDERLVWRQLRSGAPARPAEPSPPRPTPRSRDVGRTIPPFETMLVSLCGDHPRLLGGLTDGLLDKLSEPALAEVLREARDLSATEAVTTYSLIDLCPPELRDAVAAAALAGRFSRSEHPEQALTEIAQRIFSRSVDRELEELKRALLQATGSGNLDRAREINDRIKELHAQKAGPGS